MDEGKQLNSASIVYYVPADLVEDVKALLERQTYFYRLADQDRTPPARRLSHLWELIAGEVCRLNDAGVSIGLLMRLDMFSQWPPVSDQGDTWAAFMEYLKKWHAHVEVTHAGKQVSRPDPVRNA